MMRRQRFRRGIEFGQQRALWEAWTPTHRWLQILASPIRCLKVLHQARQSARQAGWADAFRRSWHLQALFQAAWVAGEARGWMQP